MDSKAKKRAVQKLSYQLRDKFEIIKYCGSNLYNVQWYNDANVIVRKYKGTNIYLLPPDIYPHETLDTIDEGYPSYEFSSVVSPFNNIL